MRICIRYWYKHFVIGVQVGASSADWAVRLLEGGEGEGWFVGLLEGFLGI